VHAEGDAIAAAKVLLDEAGSVGEFGEFVT
jgi:hypothetical protein